MNYSDKLKDPRWQKLRLWVMERDEFRCRICGDDESTLHVHHIYYKDNASPWDYQDNKLITLCERCHERVHFTYDIPYLSKSKPVEIIDHGFISVFDFIQAYPQVLYVFSYIENHEGIWGIEFKGSGLYLEKIMALSNLAYYMDGLDSEIVFGHNLDFNLLGLIIPTGDKKYYL